MTLEMYLKEREMQGREEGRKETTLEMIKNLVSVETPIEYIVRATGWSKEKILQTQNENPG